MKICFISSVYPPFVLGGAEISVSVAAEGLAKEGHNVLVITTSPNRKRYSEEINGVKVHRLSPMNFYPYISPKKAIVKPIYYSIDLWNPYSYIVVKTILKAEKPDVVHINNFRGLSLSVFSAVKSLKIPLIFTARDYSLICPKADLLNSSGMICNNPLKVCKLYLVIQKFIVTKKPDLVTAPSQFVIDKLKESGFFGDVKTLKVPNAIELNNALIKKDYDTIDILYVGGLSRNKGVHILINAFKEQKRNNISLHIIGKGKDEVELKKIAETDKRIFFHGFKTGEELKNIYGGANITVVPSIWYDNSPRVIYESFMQGTPVIGSRIGGIPELVEDGYNGFLFEAGNVDELKAILDNLIKSPDKLKRLEEGAFVSAKKYNTVEHIKKLEDLYREVQEDTR